MKPITPFLLLMVGGCVVPVARYQITDLDSKRVYTSELPDIQRTETGVILKDEQSGTEMKITHYEMHRIDDAKYQTHFDGTTGQLIRDQKVGSTP